MSTPKTVFVLGAGASTPYGLPTGAELRQDIYEHYAVRLRDVRSQQAERSALRSQNEQEMIQLEFKKDKNFAQDFRLSRTPMIDLYLNRNPDLMKIGLRAITMSILRYERRCQYGEDAKHPDEDWYSELLNKLTSDSTSPQEPDLGAAEVGFITFNYDRSLENYLYETLTRAFSMVPKDAIIKQINSIRIEHLFGKIAPLPWQDGGKVLEFRTRLEDIPLALIDQFAQNIQILYDQRDNPKLEQVKKMITKAERVFSLGFGYAPENMGLLGFPEILNTDTVVYGTTKGLSSAAIHELKRVYFPKHSDQLAAASAVPLSIKGVTLFLEDCDCLRLLQGYL